MEENYYYPELGEELSVYQPHLEFKNNKDEWIESGLIHGKMTTAFIGLYRVKRNLVER